jgi:hypothetical protein
VTEWTGIPERDANSATPLIWAMIASPAASFISIKDFRVMRATIRDAVPWVVIRVAKS